MSAKKQEDKFVFCDKCDQFLYPELSIDGKILPFSERKGVGGGKKKDNTEKRHITLVYYCRNCGFSKPIDNHFIVS